MENSISQILNLNKLEQWKKELTEISPWPWKIYDGFSAPEGSMMRLEDADNMRSIGYLFPCNKKGKHFCEQGFIASAPEKLSTLIDLVERAQEMAEFYAGKELHFTAMSGESAYVRPNEAQEFLNYCEEKLK